MHAETASLSHLFPEPGGPRQLRGLYLGHELRTRGRPGRPFVYTNFIGSLDGRISWKNPRGYREVPPVCANPHDLRLYHELSAQADVLVTTARHLHGAAAGRAAGMLTFGESAEELAGWRRTRGLTPYPRIAAVSASLRLPERARLHPGLGEISVLTWGPAGEALRLRAEAQGYRVLVCGAEPQIDGAGLLHALGDDCRTVYSVAGPLVHSALLRAGRLDRLYLTLVQLLLGGDEFDTATSGPQFAPPPAFRLAELYHDPAKPDGKGQLFAVFDRA